MVVTIFSPAKINLFLAITGRRPDGFHDLVSVAAPLDFGDELQVEEARSQNSNLTRFSLECDDAELPVDGSNLVLKAAEAFAAATGWGGGARFQLTKRIPMGAGLGGGSSNAVAALRVLNQLAGGLLDNAQLAAVAATLGSDCALFMKIGPVVMRGRGERVEDMPETARARLSGRRVLLFKPGFGISTPWAYERMVARGTDYWSVAEAEARLAAWCASPESAEALCCNNIKAAVFEKYPALPVLREILRREFGVEARLSGSGSACFALLSAGAETAPLAARIRDCWGAATFVREARIA